MDIAVLCRRLSDNTFVRSYLLLQTLSDANVDVYGVVDDRGIHPFFDRSRFDFHTIETSTYGEWDGESVNLARVEHLGRQGLDAVRLWQFFARQGTSPDVVYVASGWKGSVGAGLLSKYASSRDAPLVVDVYDYTDWVGQVPFVDVLSYADLLLASNRPLADLLGGTALHTPVDTDRFDPADHDGEAVRSELGFAPDETVVGFVGTPRHDKGVDALVEAVATAGEDVRGLIVGAREDDPYARELRATAGDDVVFVPPVEHSEVPAYYAALDALVLAHRRTPDCEYQIPAKLFEAMSMGTPVIATDIGDMSYVLGDTGILLSDPTPAAIVDAIGTLRESDVDEMGQKARERATAEFGTEVIGRKLAAMLSEITG